MWQRRILHSKNKLSLIVAFVVFVGAFVVYAVSSDLSDFLQFDPDLAQAYQSESGQVLELQQTIEDTTVTLNWAYADQNRVAIAFSVAHAEDNEKRYHPTQYTLTNNSGTQLPLIHGYGTGGSDMPGLKLPLGQVETIMSFDATSISAPLDLLGLHLELILEEIPSPHSDLNSDDVIVYRNEDDTTTIVNRQPSKNNILGPFIFDFTAPFYEGKIIRPNQVATLANVPITLKEMIITPSETKVTLCFNEPEVGYDWSTITHIDMQSQNQIISLSPHSQRGMDETGCVINRYGSLQNHTGFATLYITELMGFNQKPSEELLRLDGPWVFELELP